MSDYSSRFSALGRLYGADGLECLHQSSVAVIGLGGVGSWAVESLARSGIGKLILIDFDDVCVSNINRQLHALNSTVGQPKVEVLAKRCLEINPELVIEKRIQFFTPSTSEDLFAMQPDVIVDAIDDRHNKVHLIAECRTRGVAVVTCGGAGGRLDPTKIEVADLSRTHNDPLLYAVRKELRRAREFPRNKRVKWDIPCVFTSEPLVYPKADGGVCSAREEDSELRLNCESGFGTATHITGVFGFLMAAEAIKLCLRRTPHTEEEAVEVLENSG